MATAIGKFAIFRDAWAQLFERLTGKRADLEIGSQGKSRSTAGPILPSIYDKRTSLRNIGAIYLYHVVPADEFKNSRVYCYWGDDNPIIDKDAKIKQMIENAVRARNNPLPCGQFLSDIKMRRPSYLVLAYEGPLRPNRPLRILNRLLGGMNGESAHTFSDADEAPSSYTVDGRVIYYVTVINSIYNLSKADLGYEIHDVFKMSCFDAAGTDILRHAHIHSIEYSDHESGGTNMGPPVTPP